MRVCMCLRACGKCGADRGNADVRLCGGRCINLIVLIEM